MAGSEYDHGGSNGKRCGGEGVRKEEGGRPAGGKVVTLSLVILCFGRPAKGNRCIWRVSCSICLEIII